MQVQERLRLFEYISNSRGNHAAVVGHAVNHDVAQIAIHTKPWTPFPMCDGTFHQVDILLDSALSISIICCSTMRCDALPQHTSQSHRK